MSGHNPTIAHSIETVITSRPSQPHKGNYEMETSETTHSTTSRKNNKEHQEERPRIIVLGDSHARGLARELLHQAKQHFKVSGSVKPNAGLTDLLNTAKEDTSKLTKKDSLIVFGGTNDVEKNLIGKNLTSVMNFLNATQHTKVILIDVPLRYDPGKRPHINEEIMNYNRKLHKVTKCFKHVKLIKATNNREFFTQHRLHLNKKGKEMMSNKIIEKLLINVDSQEVDVIYLPWKIDSAKQ